MALIECRKLALNPRRHNDDDSEKFDSDDRDLIIVNTRRDDKSCTFNNVSAKFDTQQFPDVVVTREDTTRLHHRLLRRLLSFIFDEKWTMRQASTTVILVLMLTYRMTTQSQSTVKGSIRLVTAWQSLEVPISQRLLLHCSHDSCYSRSQLSGQNIVPERCSRFFPQQRRHTKYRYARTTKARATVNKISDDQYDIALNPSYNYSSFQDHYNPNAIQPHTDTLMQSLQKFVVHATMLRQKEQKRQERIRRLHQLLSNNSAAAAAVSSSSSKSSLPFSNIGRKWKTKLMKLNEQRKNLATLADYGPSIVTPSFSFLLLGALMASIIPYYYSHCIQLVATLNGNPTKVIRALLGLLIASRYVCIL
jgi:hypothetical protein